MHMLTNLAKLVEISSPFYARQRRVFLNVDYGVRLCRAFAGAIMQVRLPIRTLGRISTPLYVTLNQVRGSKTSTASNPAIFPLIHH
jgi:hypothetical protein